jgi:hypothetical protein
MQLSGGFYVVENIDNSLFYLDIPTLPTPLDFTHCYSNFTGFSIRSATIFATIKSPKEHRIARHMLILVQLNFCKIAMKMVE